MRITNLLIKGYQGVNYLDLNIDRPILLVAGQNHVGKTTVRDAIQFAITGESSRVSLKKDYPSLVRVGSDPKKSEVSLTADGFTFTRQVATGKGSDLDYPEILPFLLGGKSLARSDLKEKQKTLLAATGVKRDTNAVKEMLEKRKIDAKCIELSLPMLRVYPGFPNAEKFCATKKSEARGGWQTVTGETFGEKKADGWEAPEEPSVPLKELEDTERGLVKDLNALMAKVAELEEGYVVMRQHTHSSGLVYDCPQCEAKLRLVSGKLALDETGEAEEPPMAEQNKPREKLDQARRDLAEVQNAIVQVNGQIDRAKNAERIRAENTQKAAALFAEYQQWGEAEAAYSAKGIPLQFLEAGLKPFNARLHQTSEMTGWREVVIGPDLEIRYGGIPYGLCSESEQWRVDAAIAEALSALSGSRIFILDRMDVLHPASRGAAIRWLTKITTFHDTIIVLATLKDPAKIPGKDVMCVWLDEGGEAAIAA